MKNKNETYDIYKDIGMLVIRFGIGPWFAIVHGLPKILGGPEMWKMLGGSMTAFGITFAPEFWGFMAALAEFAGGIFITFGLFTRVSSVFMAVDMIVAASTHFIKHDPWGVADRPLQLMAVFFALVLMGAGRISIDHLIFGERDKKESYRSFEPVMKKAG